LHSFSKFSFETYLNLWLSIFPCNHANEVLLVMVSTKIGVSFPPQTWYLTLYVALHISCNLAEV
jgi:hypothetical protein